MSDAKDEATKQRQRDCKHSCVKGTADAVSRCVWCGINESDIQPPPIMTPWGFHTGSTP